MVWGVIDFALDYKGGRTLAATSKKEGLQLGFSSYIFIDPAMPLYHLIMRVTNFPNQVHDSVFLTMSFKSNLLAQRVLRGRRDYGFSDNVESKYISNQNKIPLKDLCKDHWFRSSKQSDAKFDEKFFETLQQTIPQLAAAITTKKLNAAKLNDIEAKDQLKKLVSEKDKDCFVDEVSQLKAARAWIIAYCRLLGVSEYVVDQLAKELIYDFEEFIQDPSLFDAQDNLTIRCLGRIQDGIRGDVKLPAGVSPVRLKASDIINQIDHFHQRQLSDRLVLEEKISKQLSIDKNELLQPYQNMYNQLEIWCTEWLNNLGDKAKKSKTYTSCNASYKKLTELFAKLDQAPDGRGKIGEDRIKVFEDFYKTGIAVHYDLCALSVYSKDKYAWDIDSWKDSKTKEDVIKMLKELSRTSPVAGVANPAAADVKDVKDEKTRPLESAKIPSSVGMVFWEWDEKMRAPTPDGTSPRAGNEALRRVVG